MTLRLLSLIAILLGASSAQAQRVVRPSTADSFRLGVGGDTLCRIQRSAAAAVASGMFDRAYALVCRDAALPVGHLFAFRSDTGSTNEATLARLDRARREASGCGPSTPLTLPDIGAAARRGCTTVDGLGYDVLSATRGRTLFVVEGLAAYRSALELALRTLVADRIVDGPITIALTGGGNAASFARVQAGSLDPALALTEGYRRNNTGNYAEASEFFDTLLQHSGGAEAAAQGEYRVNRALQQSDLGNFDAADALFAEAAASPSTNPVLLRQRRNYRALDLVNRGDLGGALATLDAPVETPTLAAGNGVEIDRDTAVSLNGGVPLAAQLGVGRALGLTPADKMALLDAQALALRGTVLRLQGRPDDAAAALTRAVAAIDAIRGGRVTSVARLRAGVLTDRALLAEDGGRVAEAEGLLRTAVAIVAAEYPATLALQGADARLAALLARHGKVDEALGLYRGVVAALGASGGASPSFGVLLDPYVALLVARLPSQPALADDLFFASQALLRPGVADTQATLARELSGGSNEASRLFRASLNLTREANVVRLELSRLLALPAPTRAERTGIDEDRAQLVQIEADQRASQARLTQFPAYRAIATQALTLAELRTALMPGEVYWKLSVVGPSLYAQLITHDALRAWRIALDPADVARRVDALRATIAYTKDGHAVTHVFDAEGARVLFVALAGPSAETIATARHLIFEPDGAMVRLPVTLLVAGDNGLDQYRARQRQPKADPFDMTGIDWLGRAVPVSVALSARAFRDVRATSPSRAPGLYLGFGDNAPVPAFLQLTSYTPPTSAIDCRWPLSSWNHPIAPDELYAARDAVGAKYARIVTGAAFSDSDIVQRRDLSDYRIVHFATHGLVDPPHPQCPAQPALLTSFAAKGSDGLLTFAEIYGLRFDADLVLLSACDTASSADIAATRSAGVETGGGNALDGLVRAFIGAGARAVLASHWVAPDDFRATEQLITGLFRAPAREGMAEALRRSQTSLMNALATSHPYYWAGFVLIGDGAKPLSSERH